MKKINLLIFVFCSKIAFSQLSEKFKNIINIKEDNRMTCYLGASFSLSNRECGKYFAEIKMDTVFFHLTDSIKIYDNNDKLKLKGSYINGKKEGRFISFFENGQIEYQGKYQADKKIDTWLFYYPNGKLKKWIYFVNEYGNLVEFYDENGTQTVKDGNGNIKDNVIKNGSITNIKGEIKNGAPDGKWEMSVNGIKVGTEFFENRTFVKGISHSSLMGDSEYFDNYFASFLDTMPIDFLRLNPPLKCQILGTNFSLNKNFNEVLEQNFVVSPLNGKLTNGWFFVGMNYNQSNILSNIEIFSNQSEGIISKLKDIIIKTERNANKVVETKDYYKLMAIVVLDNILYLPQNQKIELLKQSLKFKKLKI